MLTWRFCWKRAASGAGVGRLRRGGGVGTRRGGWATSLAGDVAAVLALGGVVGRWRLDENALAWPKRGHSPGAQRRRWRPRVLVVVVVVKGKLGRSQCVTFVTFQPRLLDLATRGRLLVINGNYY